MTGFTVTEDRPNIGREGFTEDGTPLRFTIEQSIYGYAVRVYRHLMGWQDLGAADLADERWRVAGPIPGGYFDSRRTAWAAILERTEAQ